MQLNEQITERSEVIRENLPKGVLARVWYKIMRFGKRNENKRIYERACAEKVLSDKNVLKKLKSRTLFGDQEHPELSQTKLNWQTTSHIISEMRINEEEQVLEAAFDILPGNPGAFINSLLEAGCLVGVSTRADGGLSEEISESGEKYSRVIPEQYVFYSADFTADPSTENKPENIIKATKSKYEAKEINKEVACALFEFVGTPEALKLSESVKQDLQHQSCKHKLGEKQCTGNCAHHNKPVATSIDLPESATKNLTVGSFVRINEKSGVVAHIFPRTKKAIIQFADCKETVAISECVQINEDNSFEQTNDIANKLFGKAYKDLTFKEKEQVLDTQSGDNKPNDNNVADNTSSPNISTTATGEKPAATKITPPVVQIPPAPNSEPVRGFYKSGDGELLFVDKVKNNEVSLVRQNGTDQILPLADFNNLKAVKNDEITDKSLANNVTEAKEYFQFAQEIRESNKVQKIKEKEVTMVSEAKIKEYLNDNQSSFSDTKEAIANLVSTFKISEEKASELVNKIEEKKIVIVDSIKENYVNDVINYGEQVAKLEKQVATLVEANVILNDVKRELDEANKGKLELTVAVDEALKIVRDREATISELRTQLSEANEVDNFKLSELHSNVSEIKKLKESLTAMKNLHEAESKKTLEKVAEIVVLNNTIKSLKENTKSLNEAHKKNLIKIVVESKLDKSGLKIPKQNLAILENCSTVEEVDHQIKQLQNTLRENLVNSSPNINEIKVEQTSPKSPVHENIDKHISNALKNFGI
jgi:hypothetical protein